MKLSRHLRQPAADQREQIGRFGERIVPNGKMPRGARHIALRGEIAVGEQHRRFGFVGLDARGVDRHHVGTVEKIGDAAKTLGLALGAIGRAGAVEAHELGVVGRIDDGLDLELERPVRRLRDGEIVSRGDKVLRRQRLAVEQERFQLQLLAVEHERRRRAGAVGLELEPGANRRRSRMERNIEIDGFDQPVGRAVILQADGAVFFGAHDRLDVGVLWPN